MRLARGLLCPATMEFDIPDRCAAYTAARMALAAVHRLAAAWPPDVADHARRAAASAVVATAEAIDHAPGTAARRRSVRCALDHAVELTAQCDVARALGIPAGELDALLREAARSVAHLGLFLSASSAPLAEREVTE